MTEVDGLNSGYARALLEDYLENPDAVPSEWRALFESGESDLVATQPGLVRLLEVLHERGNGDDAVAQQAPAAAPPGPAPTPAAPDDLLLGGVAAAMALVKAFRMHGHLAAHLDPLGSEPPGDPALEPERLIPPLTPELQARIPASVLRLYVPGETLAEALPHLRETYTGTIAYEIEHISDHEQRVWLRQAIESGRYRAPRSPEEKRRLLERLTEVEGIERYLRRAFLGQKQFSIEGLDVMVPMLDESIELAAQGRRARGRDRDGAPRPPERPRPHRSAAPTRRSCASSRASARSTPSSPTPRAAPATSSTTSAPRARGTRRPATSRSRSPRTRATSRPSTRSSRAAPAPSRPTARRAPASTTRPSRCRC